MIFLTKEEKKNIETFIEKCKKYDESVEIKRVTVGEESRILDTVCKTLNQIEKLQEENEQLKNVIAVANKIEERIKENYIPIQKIKDKIEELKKKVEELTDDKGYWGGNDLLDQIEVLQELLESEE